MGFIEDIEARTDLSDELKRTIIADHRKEVDPLTERNRNLAAQSRKETVEAEVTQLSNLGFSEAPGLLKYVRRVFLSDDAEPGVVLLSDTDMGLSGDMSTGASGREEATAAGVLREFIKLLPRNEEGKINLSDSIEAVDNHSRPANRGPDDNSGDKDLTPEEAQARRARLSGRSIDREAVRAKRYGRASVVGGA